MRRALASVLPASGLSGIPAPVEGFTRITVPESADGVAGCAQVLAAQGAALGRRRRLHATDPPVGRHTG